MWNFRERSKVAPTKLLKLRLVMPQADVLADILDVCIRNLPVQNHLLGVRNMRQSGLDPRLEHDNCFPDLVGIRPGRLSRQAIDQSVLQAFDRQNNFDTRFFNIVHGVTTA